LPSLAEHQARFARTLLDPARPAPPGLSGPAGAARAERFAVYRNNVAVGLIEALRAAFPVVDRLVGEAFFSAMARAHAFETPPGSPVLLAYGGDFPAFIGRFEPAASLPYLADVAALEWAWLEAYHAPEAAPLTPADLAAAPQDQLATLHLALHPSLRWLSSAHPALTLWRRHQAQAEPTLDDIDHAPERALVVRPEAEVQVIDLPEGAEVFLQALAAGRSLAQAAERALDAAPALDLADLMPRLFAAGAFAGWSLPERSGGANGGARWA